MVYAEAAAKGKVFGNTDQIVCEKERVIECAHVRPGSEVTSC